MWSDDATGCPATQGPVFMGTEVRKNHDTEEVLQKMYHDDRNQVAAPQIDPSQRPIRVTLITPTAPS
jgi:hypothetical protein